MRHSGKLTEWNDTKGFGFITPAAGGPRVFVHISAFSRRQRRPVVSDRLSYTVSRDGNNRLRAAQARVEGAAASRAGGATGLALAVSVAVAFFAALAALAVADRLPPVFIALYAVASGLSFVMYGIDKNAARRGRRRTAEATLHLFELLGGWPGALIAQRLFRHKTRKLSYQLVFWGAVAANCVAVGWLTSADQAVALRALLRVG